MRESVIVHAGYLLISATVMSSYRRSCAMDSTSPQPAAASPPRPLNASRLQHGALPPSDVTPVTPLPAGSMLTDVGPSVNLPPMSDLGPAPAAQSMAYNPEYAFAAVSVCSLCQCRVVYAGRTVCSSCGKKEVGALQTQQTSFIGTLSVASAAVLHAPKMKGTTELTYAALQKAGVQVVSACAPHELEMERGDRLTMEQTVQAILAPGEEMRFSFATTAFQFSAIAPGSAPDPVRNAGLLLLTNQRMVCLTHTRSAASELAYAPGEQQNVKGAYALSHKLADRTWLFPIPLPNLRHVSLESETSVGSNMTLGRELRPCCCGFWETCGGCRPGSCCCGRCCEDDALFTYGTPSNSAVAHAHTLSIGLMLPPWDQQFTLKVSVNPFVPLVKLHKFTALVHALKL